MYADYSYYVSEYLLGRTPAVPEADFPYWEKQAGKEIDRHTFGRLKADTGRVTVDVQDCACAVTELLYKADVAAQAADTDGLSGPLVSWSNDGDSGSVDLRQSIYTVDGRRKEIVRLMYLYLEGTGLLSRVVAE